MNNNSSKLLLAGAVILAISGNSGNALSQSRAKEPAPTANIVKPGRGVSPAPTAEIVKPGGGVSIVELSVRDCRTMGGKVEVWKECAKVGGNEVGLKCTISGNGYEACIDEAVAK